MRIIHVLVSLCLVVFGRAGATSPLDDSTLADKALAAIGARVPNSTNKCTGCHRLDADKLRSWFTVTGSVSNQCFDIWNKGHAASDADATLSCLSINKTAPYQFAPKGLGLWAARVNSEDFTEIFKTQFEANWERELNRFRQRAYMPRSGAPGFTDEQWAAVKEYADRGAPLLDEKLAGHSQVRPAAPAEVEDIVITSELNSPWAVTASPDGQIWITEKDGQIKIFDGAYKPAGTVSGFEDLEAVGQGGLLDLAFHPNYLQNGWIYVAYTVSRENGYNTQINRYTYRNGALSERKIILNGPSGQDSAHFGCRLVFDDNGLLYASFGERHQKEKAQDKNQLHGKTVRLNDDGTVPRDNPFGVSNPVFTLGHRNPQGLAIHPLSKKLVDSEHGPTGYDAPGGGDEVNILKAGANYGWPVIHHRLTRKGMETPLQEWTPAVAPSGIAFYTGDKIPQWKNDLFVATLAGATLFRLTIDANGRLTNTERLLEDKYGRLRDVGNAPDGTLLVVTDGGQLIQLRPK